MEFHDWTKSLDKVYLRVAKKGGIHDQWTWGNVKEKYFYTNHLSLGFIQKIQGAGIWLKRKAQVNLVLI